MRTRINRRQRADLAAIGAGVCILLFALSLSALVLVPASVLGAHVLPLLALCATSGAVGTAMLAAMR